MDRPLNFFSNAAAFASGMFFTNALWIQDHGFRVFFIVVGVIFAIISLTIHDWS